MPASRSCPAPSQLYVGEYKEVRIRSVLLSKVAEHLSAFFLRKLVGLGHSANLL